MSAAFRRPPVSVEPGGTYRVLLVCSSGGHLAQLEQLRPWWSQLERTWVCPPTDDVRSTLAGEDVVEGHHPTTRHLPNLWRNALLAGQAPDISPATARRTIWVIRLELLLLVCLPFLASLMARGVGYSS